MSPCQRSCLLLITRCVNLNSQVELGKRIQERMDALYLETNELKITNMIKFGVSSPTGINAHHRFARVNSRFSASMKGRRKMLPKAVLAVLATRVVQLPRAGSRCAQLVLRV